MLVRAVRLGYYDNLRRRPGDEFEIKSEKEFSDAHRGKMPGWMEKVVGAPVKSAETKPKSTRTAPAANTEAGTGDDEKI
jgi:hypothetical protein